MRSIWTKAAPLAGVCVTLFSANASPRPKLILIGKSTHTDGNYNYDIEGRLGVHIAKGNAARVAFGTNAIGNGYQVYVWTRATGCVTEVPPISYDEFNICTPDERDKQLLGGISSEGDYIVGTSEGEQSNAGAFRWEFGDANADDLAVSPSLWNERAVGVSVTGSSVAMGGDSLDGCGAGTWIASKFNPGIPSESIMNKSVWNCDTTPAAWVIPTASNYDISTIAGTASVYTCCLTVPDFCIPTGYAWRWDVGSNPEAIKLDTEYVPGFALGVSTTGDAVVGAFVVENPLGPMFYSVRYVAFRATGGGNVGEILMDIPIDVSGIGGCYTNDYGLNSCISSYAADSNDDWIVGEVSWNAVAWIGENADPVNLNERFACLKPANLVLLSATSISNDGRFVAGHARYTSESQTWAWVVDQGSCPADFNEDGFVDDTDFIDFFLPAYNLTECSPCTATCEGSECMKPGINDCTIFSDSPYEACMGDLNWDGIVGDADFVIFSAAYALLECPTD
ncbi:MAG: hypothetical protein J0L78_11280 [Planctomycetes bacterium]|nr:hypothetical protein [Planctomycetota bacterium]